MDAYDIIIVGGGIAGSGLAWALARGARVCVLEAEHVPGYHTTGRSAAFFAETYGGPAVQPYTTLSKSFFQSPPAGFSDQPLIQPRGALHVYRAGEEAAGQRLMDEMGHVDGVAHLDGDAVAHLAPHLAAGRFVGGVYDPACGDLDVAALHQAYLKGARRMGAEFRYSSPLTEAVRRDGGWDIKAGGEAFRAKLLVNAAGAWGDRVAERAGAAPVGLVPKRRTVIRIPAEGALSHRWPLVLDAQERWYFKPEGDGFLVSPADQTPSAPCDACPEDLDVANAAARFEAATGRSVTRVLSKWAGLRTFAPSGAPVIGFDKAVPDFFWSVGQAGWGIQTSPAWVARAAQMILGQVPDQCGLSTDALTACFASH